MVLFLWRRVPFGKQNEGTPLYYLKLGWTNFNVAVRLTGSFAQAGGSLDELTGYGIVDPGVQGIADQIEIVIVAFMSTLLASRWCNAYFRGVHRLAWIGRHRDYIGMIATVMNALTLPLPERTEYADALPGLTIAVQK